MPSADREVPKAVVFGCAGTRLSDAERAFFAANDPFGFILFARNCGTPEQVRDLVSALREAVGRSEAPVLIDQEGGRVARLKPPHWRLPPAAGRIGALYLGNLGAGLEAAGLNARLIAADLGDLGIDVDCLPVLDVPAAGSNQAVVGDRAFTADAAANAKLGRAVCEGLLDGGVMPILKHMPGHGRATADSHYALPVLDASLAELRAVDFVPFRELAEYPAGMVAHLLIPAVDAADPASASPIVIAQLIRGDIGFDGLLFSDDIGMAALGGNMGERAARVLAAGCDIAVHCSGDMAEMVAVAAAASPLTPAAMKRVARARAFLHAPKTFDRVAAISRVDELLAMDSST